MSRERYPKNFPDLPSVTTILGAFPSPALIGWYKKMMAKEIKEISDKGLAIGSILHGLRIRIEKGEPFEITTQYSEEVKNCLKSYLQWKKERELTHILQSETPMYSEKLGYVGTFDDLVKRGDDFVLLEYKTNNAIYDEHLEQVVAYKKLAEYFLKIKIKELWVIRFSKDKPSFYDIPLYETRQVLESETEEFFEMFNHKLAIYNFRKKRDIQWRLKNANND